MSLQEQELEKEIQAKGRTAPRLTPELIDGLIIGENYITPPDGCTTIPHGHMTANNEALACLMICVLVLRNGYTVVGKSACASPQNFDAELARKIAREDACRQIWAPEGYALRSRLAEVPCEVPEALTRAG